MPRNELLHKRGLRTAGIPHPIRPGYPVHADGGISDFARGMVAHNCVAAANDRYVDYSAQFPERADPAFRRIVIRESYYSDDYLFFIGSVAQIPWEEVLSPDIPNASAMRTRALWINDIMYVGEVEIQDLHDTRQRTSAAHNHHMVA